MATPQLATRRKKRGATVSGFISYKYNILIYTLYTKIALNHIHKSGKHVNKKAADNLKNQKQTNKWKKPPTEIFSCTSEWNWREGSMQRAAHSHSTIWKLTPPTLKFLKALNRVLQSLRSRWWNVACWVRACANIQLMTSDPNPEFTTDSARLLQHWCSDSNIYVRVPDERTTWLRTRTDCEGPR